VLVPVVAGFLVEVIGLGL